MGFEFDSNKSKSNQKKHGIDFIEAQKIWGNPILEINSKDPREPRKLIVGFIEKIYWTAIITLREGNIRIISVRRARDEEKKIFKQNNRRKS